MLKKTCVGIKEFFCQPCGYPLWLIGVMAWFAGGGIVVWGRVIKVFITGKPDPYLDLLFCEE